MTFHTFNSKSLVAAHCCETSTSPLSLGDDVRTPCQTPFYGLVLRSTIVHKAQHMYLTDHISLRIRSPDRPARSSVAILTELPQRGWTVIKRRNFEGNVLWHIGKGTVIEKSGDYHSRHYGSCCAGLSDVFSSSIIYLHGGGSKFVWNFEMLLNRLYVAP
jgi:hypothetical protein